MISMREKATLGSAYVSLESHPLSFNLFFPRQVSLFPVLHDMFRCRLLPRVFLSRHFVF